MTTRHFIPFSDDYTPANAPLPLPILGSNGYGHLAEFKKDTNQTIGTTAAVVSEMVIPIKNVARYKFVYELVYTTSGLAPGVQFAVSLNGVLVDMNYALTVANADNSLLGGIFIGTANLLGGTKVARVIGSVVTGGIINDPPFDLILTGRATGIGASMTILKGSAGTVVEV